MSRRIEFSRTEMLIGPEALDRLAASRVAVFGIGGVGTYVVEGLARCGVGHFVLVDDDVVALSNINRQLHALHSTVGQPKVQAMKDRVLDINPQAQVETVQQFYLPDRGAELVRQDYDYIVDAMDTVSAKIDLIMRAKALGIPVISSMGAGNKLDPTRFVVTDLSKTSVCPLAKVMRTELRRRGVERCKVVYSTEPPLTPRSQETHDPPREIDGRSARRRAIPASISFVPSVAGLMIAGEVVKDIIGQNQREG